jgi:hypothetical protein
MRSVGSPLVALDAVVDDVKPERLLPVVDTPVGAAVLTVMDAHELEPARGELNIWPLAEGAGWGFAHRPIALGVILYPVDPESPRCLLNLEEKGFGLDVHAQDVTFL